MKASSVCMLDSMLLCFGRSVGDCGYTNAALIPLARSMRRITKTTSSNQHLRIISNIVINMFHFSHPKTLKKLCIAQRDHRGKRDGKCETPHRIGASGFMHDSTANIKSIFNPHLTSQFPFLIRPAA